LKLPVVVEATPSPQVEVPVKSKKPQNQQENDPNYYTELAYLNRQANHHHRHHPPPKSYCLRRLFADNSRSYLHYSAVSLSMFRQHPLQKAIQCQTWCLWLTMPVEEAAVPTVMLVPKVGAVENTNDPVPVSSDITPR